MKIASIILNVLKYLIFADILLSWFMPDRNVAPRSLIVKLTDPMYAPIHALISPEKTGGFDVSPLVILLIIYAARFWVKTRMAPR